MTMSPISPRSSHASPTASCKSSSVSVALGGSSTLNDQLMLFVALRGTSAVGSGPPADGFGRGSRPAFSLRARAIDSRHLLNEPYRLWIPMSLTAT
eukprot:CAMPEP_0181197376 /NCGR_PEP_ID=MMETSP1096-20121128/16005_1 /TAXON_ID=156174 ORGANISM="Chrysochromulina ericina, Strain CCMP281" /NCGR_SAMPLE_ID=MMETSP1096 /ASSEMBLY_ACC=CAM_ASM_000453 /LENGTH=95 /DNA_ID=CAMNT_0023287277 /DNA_START=899 /DNA_END=1187 /DNA_ORIENTATION=+